MNPSELTRQIKALWKTSDEIKQDMKGFRVELVEQGKMMARIDTNMDRLANALVAMPPKDKFVEHDMRIKALEETVDDIEDRQQCQGCKNDERVDRCVKFMDTWTPRLWMGFGVILFFQFSVPIIVKLLWH